jgi:hypothetical protein
VAEGVKVTVRVVVGVLVSTGVSVPVAVPEALPAGATGSILPQSQARGMAAKAIKIKIRMDRFMSSAFQGCLRRFKSGEVSVGRYHPHSVFRGKFQVSYF